MNVAALSPSPSHPTRIISATFKPIRGENAAINLTVFAENLHIGGMPLLARVGTQSVDNLIPIAGSRGFTGTLAHVPHEGDRLYLRYMESVEVPTDVVYHGGGGGQGVA